MPNNTLRDNNTSVKIMFPTPDISHLSSSDYEDVYEPAEDTFLFLDALEKELEYLLCSKPAVCVEVGCGSGVVSTFLARLLSSKQHHAYYMCVDINPKAATVTARTAEQNHVILCPILSDLTSAVDHRLAAKVDILLFNPPYVVTPSHEVGSAGIEASWAGGDRGREVMDRFFPRVASLLSPKGVFYLIVIKENDIEEIGAVMQSYGMEMTTVLQRRSGPEHLSVLKFTRTGS